MFKCKICKKNFKDLFEHLSGKEEGFLEVKDKRHEEYLIKIDDDDCDEFGYHNVKCFCGGEIKTFSRGEEGWEKRCLECGFIYDED